MRGRVDARKDREKIAEYDGHEFRQKVTRKLKSIQEKYNRKHLQTFHRSMKRLQAFNYFL